MLHYIKGKVTMKTDSGVVIECGGLGYEVTVPENSAVYLVKEGEETMLYTAMLVREDDVSVYGFSDKESLALFRKLMTVNGVGAKAAVSILSAMPLDTLKKAIVFDDAASLTKANGVGKKTAQRIVLELKDKIGAFSDIPESAAFISQETTGGRSEAINGLISLGYSKSEAVSALAGIKEEDLTTEQYIKLALKNLF